ncbi:L,D-transpeptidase [Kitasatospora sp. MMS16-BH015]|uniref:L,D-transpeptidase n=1 Tax=Kitasatospora sp. MMS16-BH015 TaxID=2018025 RepID=UPI000CA1ECAA|nr:Ig-like domain-containing protein [Kitasatospora sp. MMS16-BH015]AUG76809.1 L,D-transpeptidase [Kitasatospora sp. MMS16-BH015]
MSGTGSLVRRTAVAAALAVLAPVAGCSSSGGNAAQAVAAPEAVDAGPLVHLPAGAAVDPSQPLTVTAEDGSRLTDVTVTGSDGRLVAGELASDQHSWHSTGRLHAGTTYTVRVAADDGHGGRGDTSGGFSTTAPKDQITADLGPDSAGTGVYGVGQPLTVKLSEPVEEPAARQEIERSLQVVSQPAVTGAWYWVDDKELHFRPQEYWPAGTRIRLSYDRPGALVSAGRYVGEASSRSFTIGDRVEALVDAGSHQMTYRRNGAVVATFPVTTGKPGFSTRNGIKVVLGQESLVRMNGETIGIKEGSKEAYDLDVHWATRVTWSGEYVHAAPWSVGSQGVENVSHGCTGMSTDNAKWFFDQTRIGDIVQVVNSQGAQMEPFGNGFGDWNVDWGAWVKHSALGRAVSTAGPGDAAADAGADPVI